MSEAEKREGRTRFNLIRLSRTVVVLVNCFAPRSGTETGGETGREKRREW